MLCVSVGRTRHQQMMAEHQNLAQLGAELVELRLDYIGRSVDLIACSRIGQRRSW